MRTTLLSTLLATLCLTSLASAAALPGATPGPKNISPAGVSFIAGYEKVHLVPYPDPVHCTVGFGHKISDYGCNDPRSAAKVAQFLPRITMARALAMYRNDLGSSVKCVNDAVTLPLTQGQFDALVSFAFNAGCGSLRTIAQTLNTGDLEAAGRRMALYNKGDDWVGPKGHRRRLRHTLQGLVDRRRAEDQQIVGHLLSGKKTAKPKHGLKGANGKPLKLPAPPKLSVNAHLLPKPPATTTPAPQAQSPSPGSDSTPPDGDGTPVGDCPIGPTAEFAPIPDGCSQFEVDVVPSFVSSDPTDHFNYGRGGGSATIEPIGHTVMCNASGSGTCSYFADVPTGTTVTITATPLSVTGSPALPGDPPDSAIGAWGGACSGTGSCSFAVSSNHLLARVSFVPALATLTVNATGTGTAQAEVIANAQEGSNPRDPSYCSNTIETANAPLPCRVTTRVDGTIYLSAVASDASGVAFLDWAGDPCAAAGPDPSDCRIEMDRDHTVTARFGPAAIG